MLTLYYFSNAECIRSLIDVQFHSARNHFDDSPIYAKHLIKEFPVENPPLEPELAETLCQGMSQHS
ncbi:GSCOCG00008789001-RA-CDS, partial [Cotesia congregata]